MFDIIKQNVDLLFVLEKDLNVTFKQIGDRNWAIDGDKDVEGCPFCGHHDCFRVSHVEGENATSFYKCFSCGEAGDVISWRAKHLEIPMKDAALGLAKEFNLSVPNNYNPVQQVFTLAALYYHNCLIDGSNRPLAILNGKTPKSYQIEIRGHKEETLLQSQVGFSDGGLISYLESIGIDVEVIQASGLMNKSGKDFLPTNCFIYPHFVKGRVSHFTFKDPLKRLAYQLPKKCSLNGYMFYGQDSIGKSDVVMLVEGENDLLSVMESGEALSVLATIGTLSREQLDWLRSNLSSKKVLTLFDPDDAGDKYRERIEAVRSGFYGLLHVKPPENKDIDDHLRGGAKLSEIIKANLVQVTVSAAPSRAGQIANQVVEVESDIEVPWGAPPVKPQVVTAIPTIVAPLPTPVLEPPQEAPTASTSSYKPPAALSELNKPSAAQTAVSGVVSGLDEDGDVLVETDDSSVKQYKGCYWKTKFNKDGAPSLIKLSNFYLKLLNIFENEDGDREREVVAYKEDGYVTQPFLIGSETKVSHKSFKVLMAKQGDCEWRGTESDLDSIWRIIMAQSTSAVVYVPKHVGRNNERKGWIFKNVFISQTGVSSFPDENGIFWGEGKKFGTRPRGLNETDDPTDRMSSIPELVTDMSAEDTDELLGDFTRMLALNTGVPGTALMALGWMNASIYSDFIYKMNGGMCMFMLWGTHGDGKTTVVRWINDIFDMGGKGYTQVAQLTSKVGFQRQGDYYSSLPLVLDELRSANEATIEALPMIRSWYDRSSRVMGVKDSFGVRTTKIRSTLFLSGEDLPEDPATRERCIIARLPKHGRETKVSYEWFETNKHLFSAIGYRWVKDSCSANMEEVTAGMKELDELLVKAGCTRRISKSWASAGYFAKKLADKYLPDFDFLSYIVAASREEHDAQKQDGTVALFWENVENIMAQDNSPISIAQVLRENDVVHIWYPNIFSQVKMYMRGQGGNWSKNAVLKAIKDEPYFITDQKKVSMGLSGVRRNVITLSLKNCPESLLNIAQAN